LFGMTAAILACCAGWPLIIDLSIDMTGSYLIPFAATSVLGIIHSVSVLFLPTPKHDELRTLKRRATLEIDGQNGTDNTTGPNLDQLARSVSLRLANDKRYHRLQNVVIILLLIAMAMHGGIEMGLLRFSTAYCGEHLDIDDKYGRYMITTYFTCHLSYRVMGYLFFPDPNLPIHCMLSYFSRALLLTLFMIFGDQMLVMFVIYGGMGFSASPIVAAIPSWIEKIKPLTGVLMSSTWVMYGAQMLPSQP